MGKFKIQIDSILGGISDYQSFGKQGQYEIAQAIDPELMYTDAGVRSSGLLRPSAMAKFSGATVTGKPLWIITNPKTSNIYVYASDGKVHTVTSALTMGADLTTPTSGAGNGAFYYDNYIYFATPTNISRYGPLDGTPAMTQTVWTSATFLNDANKALANTAYPSIGGVTIPNHPMHHHVADNFLYIGDVITTAGGSAATQNQGCLHKLKTTKTTVEGDTNSGSTYNAINFRYGYYPTCMASYGTDLAVGLIEGTNTTVIQKPAIIAFWDTTSTAPNKYIQVELPDPFITAMKNVNGVLYCFLGNSSGGVRVIRFAGGYSWEEVVYIQESVPPLHGAVDHDFDRIYWGANMTYPSTAAVVYALNVNDKSLHCVRKANATGATPLVTALKFVLHTDFRIGSPVIGWVSATSQGLDKNSSDYSVGSVWRSLPFRIGTPFEIRRIRIPLAQATATNMTIVPTLYMDELVVNTVLATINNTNFPNSEKNIQLDVAASGKHSFVLELAWSGSALAVVSLPIVIEGETLDDD